MTRNGMAVSLGLGGSHATPVAVELAREAELNGFDGVWIAEDPFLRGVLPTATAVGLSTSRLRIGIGLVNPYNRHPTLHAMEIATLDEACGGRLIWGVGASARKLVEQMGLSYSRPLAAIRDCMHIIRSMLRGDVCNYDGLVFRARGAKLGITPIRRNVPIYMGAMGPKALALCGETADGWLVSELCSRGYVGSAWPMVVASARQFGRAPANIGVAHYLWCEIDHDDHKARRRARTKLAALMLANAEFFAGMNSIQEQFATYSGLPPGEFTDIIRRARSGSVPEGIPDSVLDAYFVAGDPDRCVAVLKEYREAGSREAVLEFPSSAEAQYEISLVGREVIPKVK